MDKHKRISGSCPLILLLFEIESFAVSWPQSYVLELSLALNSWCSCLYLPCAVIIGMNHTTQSSPFSFWFPGCDGHKSLNSGVSYMCSRIVHSMRPWFIELLQWSWYKHYVQPQVTNLMLVKEQLVQRKRKHLALQARVNFGNTYLTQGQQHCSSIVSG